MPTAIRSAGFAFAAACVVSSAAPAQTPPLVVANDNRAPAGTSRAGRLDLALEARIARWQPDLDVDTTVTVLAFAEAGGPPSIPGPLVRVRAGTEVRIRLRNPLTDSIRIGPPPPGVRQPGVTNQQFAGPDLVIRGLRAGTVEHDTVRIAAGAEREIRFRATKPGTYLYWGSLSTDTLTLRTGRDGQLSGAIVVDPADGEPDPRERIFVVTVLDLLPDSAGPQPFEDIFEMAINGRSWPHTERFAHAVGDTVRWRWLNGSDTRHPMHLHGFHFKLVARGQGRGDVVLPPDGAPLGVTEVFEPGGSFRIEWVPTRPGNWLMHCHIVAHITPFPERTEEAIAHDAHDLARHPLDAMAGLVLGIEVSDPGGLARAAQPDRALRLVAREAPGGDGSPGPKGFTLAESGAKAADSLRVPGPPILLTKDELAAITVVNTLAEPTTIHWHGMELESVYDGVAGWSGIGRRLAPLVAPGDSFTVRMAPPRAGTFIYHTHMDETDQLRRGLYGPLLVLEPGAPFDPERDHVFIAALAADGDSITQVVNGQVSPVAYPVRPGTQHRLRFINIDPDDTVEISLVAGPALLRWRPLASDGADLPAALAVEGPARIWLSPGETRDVEWRPAQSGAAELVFRWDLFGFNDVVRRVPMPTR